MTRLGFEKVRTGCKTCKIRKVKCDETWPQCQRCQKGGRICSGYQAPPAGSLSWNLLLRQQPSVTPAGDDKELRSLAFFHQVVAPVLSGPFDPSFWTHLVAQSTHHEPATRHAVLAVSSLFENFSDTTLGNMNDPFAIKHYNQAIKGLLTTPIDEIDTILTVCALFICIELLRGENVAALNHARHGVRLLETRGGSSHLAAVFCHVNLFNLFFSRDDVPPAITDLPGPRVTFQGMIEAKHHLDILMGKTLYLVRSIERGQVGGKLPDSAPTPKMFQEQSELMAAYVHWGHSFARFEASEGIDTNNDSGSLALKIRWKMATIWVPNCLAGSESIYDKHVEEANCLIEMAQRALALNAKQSVGRPRKFMFDMGFSHVLHLLAIKCRYLKMRLQVTELLKGLACERESLWDTSSMLAIGRRVIEVEHGVELGTDPLETLKDRFADAKLPEEKDRVRGYIFEDADEFRLQQGVTEYRRPLCLLMYGPGGGLVQRREWITIYT